MDINFDEIIKNIMIDEYSKMSPEEKEYLSDDWAKDRYWELWEEVREQEAQNYFDNLEKK